MSTSCCGPLCIDTFAGIPEDIGKAWGRRYAPFIQALFWEGNAFHHPHPVEKELDDLADNAVAKLRRWVPAIFTELETASKECGLTVEQLALKADGFVYKRGPMRKKQAAGAGCFQIGALSDTRGPVVGSIMDSPRVCFAWWRINPAHGYKHLALTIPGTACSDRGINEKGLVVSESSTPNTGADYEKDLLLHPLATRLVLEQCSTVEEAVDLMVSLPVSHAYVFADASGNMKGLQTTPAGHTVYEPDRNGVIVLANHIRDSRLHARLVEHGYDPDYRNMNSELRVNIALEMAAAHKGDKDIAFVKSVLTSHQGYPNSICRDGNASTFIGIPAQKPDKLLIAERFPCSNPFHEYAVAID